jgi:predicted nucleic acid-binding protein
VRVLLDTNVILDFFLERQPFFQSASILFEAIAYGQIEGFVTASSATDIFYICRWQTQNLAEARDILTRVFMLLGVCSVDYQVLNAALQSRLPDFEDAVQIACAVAHGLDAIATRNPQDFQTDAIPILSVEQIIEQIA